MADFLKPDSMGPSDASAKFPPFPPCPPGPRGPAGPPGSQGLRGPAGSLNNTAQSFVYAQLAHLLEQLIDLYPGLTLRVYLSGLNPVLVYGVPYQVYKSAEGTYGGLFLLSDGGYIAFPLSAIAALQFETGTVYNPSITYLPKPDFPPGFDTNIVTAIYEYVSTIPGDINVSFYVGSVTESIGPIYLNKYGLIVQADEYGNDPSFIPTTLITAIAPQTTAAAEEQKTGSSTEAKSVPYTKIQIVTPQQ